jgi:hypothetical protein
MNHKIDQIRQTAFVSKVLIDQLNKHLSLEGEWYESQNISQMTRDLCITDGNKIKKFYCVESVLDQVLQMENKIQKHSFSSLNETSFRPFKFGKLANFDLYHIHHFQAQNIYYLAELELKKRDKELKRIYKNYPILNKAAEDQLCRLATKCTLDNLEDRGKKNNLTGDWVVLKRFEGKNYYLCLAVHEESEDSIIKRMNSCFSEFLGIFNKKN